MPRVSQFQAVVFDGFPKGLVRESAASELTTEEMAIAENVLIGARGEPYIAPGWDLLNTHSSSIFWLGSYVDPSGNQRIWAVASGGDLLYATYNGTAFTWSNSGITVSENPTSPYGAAVGSAVDAGGTLHIVRHNFRGIQWDGTTWSYSAAAGPPAGRSPIWRASRLFVFNNVSTGGRSNRIQYSNLGDAMTWDVADYIDVGGDDKPIVGAIEFADSIIIFKDREVWQLTGRTPSSFTLRQLEDSIGCQSVRLPRVLLGRLYFYDTMTGVWAFDGSNFELVSSAIQSWLMTNNVFEADGQNFLLSWIYENRYVVNYHGISTGNPPSICYDPLSNAWTQHDYYAGAATELDQTRYPLIAYTSKTYEFDSEESAVDTGTLEARVGTGWLRIGGPGQRGRVRRIELTLECQDDNAVQIEMFSDWDDVTVVENYTVTTDGAANQEFFEIAIDGWGTRCDAVKFIVSWQDRPVKLTRMVVYYTGSNNLWGDKGYA